ncbi:MAG TPA: glycosyltransferase family 2 protein [Calditrichaeota bacterium]|nr:glycosyltransferase family 2 protein [Calditrichota bacterium]
MAPLSVVIITKNVEDQIRACLESVKWADEIVVVDSGSNDQTLNICREYGCRVIDAEWQSFGANKALGVQAAKYDWILSLDADERVTPPLAVRIQDILKSGDTLAGYKIRFRTLYLGREILFSDWRNEYHLRLFNRGTGRFNEDILHESFKTDGPVGQIKEYILHNSFPSLNIHLQKINRYGLLAARQKYEAGKRSSIKGSVLRGLFAFIRIYILKAGFLDGKIGFVLAINNAFATYIKYLMLWEKQQSTKND